jgi:putrescine aminotransferase
MDDRTRREALATSSKALDLIRQAELTAVQQDGVIADCVENFEKYVNPGILEYRKSSSTDYTAVEWRDEGNCFYDIRGKEFIDCLGGFGIYMLGHRHPTVVDAVAGQLKHQALHSQELLDPMRGYLSKILALTAPGRLQYSFFCNSGTEANEGGVKLAKLYAWKKKRQHSKGVITCTKAFHGKSMGSLSLSGKAEFREPFTPLVPGVRFVPYGDADALNNELKICDMVGHDIAAFIAEPVQGEAGAIVPPDDYFPKVREICDKWGVLFIADEVQTGMGRTGTLWGMDHWPDAAPDIMTMGKALGGAVIPIGNFMATPEVFEVMFENPYIHTTTFGGNPMATSAAIAALHATIEEDIPGQAASKGAWFMERFRELQANYPEVLIEVRGIGLLIGLQFVNTDVGYAVSSGLFGEGILVAGTLFNAQTFRIEPPATLTQQQMDEIVVRLERVVASTRARIASGELPAARD